MTYFRRMKHFLLFLIYLLLSASSMAQFGDAVPIAWTDVAGPQVVHSADFNSDSHFDLMIAGGEAIGVLYGDGNGSFTRFDTLDLYAFVAEQFIDIDQDGDMDLFGTIDDSLAWLENFSNAGFGPVSPIDQVDFYDKIRAGDIDNDGDLDLVLSGTPNSQVLCYRFLGPAGFGPAEVVTSSYSSTRGLDLGDLDGDLDIDIVFGTANSQLVMFENDGFGNWAFAQLVDSANGNPINLVRVHDTDLDGDLDLYFTNANAVYEKKNDGNANFDTRLGLDIYAIDNIDFDDINGDGFDDLWQLDNDFGTSYDVDCILGDGLGGFSAPIEVYSTGIDYITQVLWRDMDEDGLNDMVANWPGEGLVGHIPNDNSLWFSTGDAVYHTHTMNGVLTLRCADLDGDGDLDVVASPETDNKLVWLENVPSGPWPEHLLWQDQTDIYESQEILCVDAEGDGDIDILADIGHWSGSLHWFINDGAGQFVQQAIFFATANRVDTVDLNSDGFTDIIHYGGSSYYHPGLPGGGFDTEIQLLQGNWSSTDGDAGDIDNDGDIDIIFYMQHPTEGLFYIENDGSNSFSQPQAISNTANFRGHPRLRDLDGDGDLDPIAFYDNSIGPIKWIKNDGGFFYQDEIIGVGTFTSNADRYLIEDMDHDGDIDLFVPQYYAPYVKYENTGNGVLSGPEEIINHVGAVWPGDFDNSGTKDLVISNGSRVLLKMNYANSPYRVEGRIYLDDDANGAYTLGEPGVLGAAVTFSPTNGSIEYHDDGTFIIYADTGSYSIQVDPINTGFAPIAPLTYNVTLSEQDSVANDVHLGLNDPSFTSELEVQIIDPMVTCVGNTMIWGALSNTGGTVLSGTVKIRLDPLLGFIQSSPTPDQILADTLIWSYSGLAPGANLNFELEVQLPGLSYEGTTLNNYIGASGSSINGIPVVTSHTESSDIDCTGNPITKTSSPEGVGSDNYIPITDELIYTIAFQNTTADTMQHLLVKDNIHSDFVPGSFIVLGASHPYQLLNSFDGGDNLTFHFMDMDLPPVSIDPVNSSGHIIVKLTIESSEVYHGSSINNSANIYFLGDTVHYVQGSSYVQQRDCSTISVTVGQMLYQGDEVLYVPDNYTYYSWYLNGSQIPGANGPNDWYYAPTSTGNYFVEVTDQYNCFVQSDMFAYVTTGIEESTPNTIQVLPNPANSRVVVKSSDRFNGFELLDVQGRTVLEKGPLNTNIFSFERGSIPSGLYVIRISGPNGAPHGNSRLIFE